MPGSSWQTTENVVCAGPLTHLLFVEIAARHGGPPRLRRRQHGCRTPRRQRRDGRSPRSNPASCSSLLSVQSVVGMCIGSTTPSDVATLAAAARSPRPATLRQIGVRCSEFGGKHGGAVRLLTMSRYALSRLARECTTDNVVRAFRGKVLLQHAARRAAATSEMPLGLMAFMMFVVEDAANATARDATAADRGASARPMV
jgi:hypothetical protein